MPLCAPKKVIIDDNWSNILEDHHFILQHNPKLRKNFYRILLKCNYYQIGEFSSYSDAIKEWNFLHPEDSIHKFDSTCKFTSKSLMNSLISLKNIEDLDDYNEQCEYLNYFIKIHQLMKDIEISMKSPNVKVNFLIVKSLISLSRQLIILSKNYIKRNYYDIKAKELFDWVLIDNNSKSVESQSPVFRSLEKTMEENNEPPYIIKHIESIHQLCKQQSIRINDMISYLQKELSNSIDNENISQCIYLVPMIQPFMKKGDDSKYIDNIIELFKDETKDSNELNIIVYNYMKNLYKDQTSPFYFTIKNGSDYFEKRIKDEIRMEEQGFYILERFKDDINNFADVVCKALTFTFPKIRQYDNIMRSFQYIIVDFILYEIYHTLIVVFKMLNKDKDSKLLSKRIFYERNTDREAFGLSVEAWSLFNREEYQKKCNAYLDLFMEKKSKFKKLIALETFYQYVTDSLLKEKKKTIGADDLMPLLCHTLSLSRGKLFTHLSFLHTFGSENDLFGKHGYILVSLESALNVDLNNHKP